MYFGYTFITESGTKGVASVGATRLTLLGCGVGYSTPSVDATTDCNHGVISAQSERAVHTHR